MNRPAKVANDPVEIRTRHLPNTSWVHDNCIKSFGGPVLMQRVSNKLAQLISCWYLANVFRAPDARLDCGRNTDSSELSEAMRPLTYISSSVLESPPEHRFCEWGFRLLKSVHTNAGGWHLYQTTTTSLQRFSFHYPRITLILYADIVW